MAPDVIAFLVPSHSKSSVELLRANKNGSKTWAYRYRVAGKLKQLKLGSYENEKREWLAKLGELLDGLGRRGKI